MHCQDVTTRMVDDLRRSGAEHVIEHRVPMAPQDDEVGVIPICSGDRPCFCDLA